MSPRSPASADRLESAWAQRVRENRDQAERFRETQSPDFYAARLNLGIALQESGQRDKAAVVYREILARAPARFSRERSAASDLLRQVVK